MDVLFNAYKYGEDPFAEEPLPQAHYHPSTQKHLTTEEKQLKLTAPHRNRTSTTRPQHTKPDIPSYNSPGERKFLQETNTMLAKELPTHDTPSPRDLSTKFDESWPTSERPSTIESPSDLSQVSSKLSSIQFKGHLMKPSTTSSLSSSSARGLRSDDVISRDRESSRSLQATKESPKDSTLAKYIRRFRYSEPKSREERNQDKASSREFWWMSPPPHSSTPTDDSGMKRMNGTSNSSQSSPLGAWRAGRQSQQSGVGRGSAVSSPKLQKASSTAPSSSSFASSVLDDETTQLQAKADKLLEQSTSTLLSEPAVSSEGVGLSPSTATTDESLFIPQLPKIQPDTENHYHGITGVHHTDIRPEDDILYQWRVRRRLEQARQHPHRMVDLELNPVEPLIPSAPNKEPDFGDSRLEDFRKRLKQQQLLSQSRKGITETLLDTKDSVCHTGTDPIPQSIATQTNGMLPSSGNLQKGIQATVSSMKSRPHDVCSGFEQDIPVRDTAAEAQTGNDILSGPKSEPWGTHHSKMWQKEEIENDGTDGIQSGSKNLIASPHIERTSAPGRGKSAVAPHLHMECDIIPCHQRVPHIHADDRVIRLYSDHHTIKQQRGINAETQPDNLGGYSAAEQEHDRDAPSMVTKHRGQSQQFPRQRLDFENVLEESPRTPPQRLGRVKGDDAEAVGGEKVRGERLPTKLVQSSPVTSAIGQVISTRLFTSTPTPQSHSPDSSVDTLPSMQQSMSAQSEASDTHDTGELTCSDGEYGEDELLQILRRRRAEYEQELQRLDQLIQDVQ